MWWIRTALAVVLVGSMVNSQFGLTAESGGPTVDEFPVLDLETPEKSIVASLAFIGQSQAELLDVHVAESPAHVKGTDPHGMGVSVHFEDGRVDRCSTSLRETAGVCYFTWHPSTSLVTMEVGEFEERIEFFEARERSRARIVLPFYPEMTTITLTLPNGERIIDVDVRPAIRSFCAAHPDDNDCGVDLGSGLTGPSDAIAGEVITYEASLNNFNDDPAQGGQIVDVLPVGLTAVGGSPGCAGDGQRVVCDTHVPSGGSATVTIEAMIDPALVYNAGGPTTLSNAVTSANSAGTDERSENDASLPVVTNVRAVSDLEILAAEVVGAPSEIIIGAPTEITVRKTLANGGPSSPMDTVLTTSGSSSGGSVAGGTTPVPALATGGARTVDERVTILCEEPGIQTFEVANTIAPANGDDSDPETSNNDSTTAFQVECIASVAINIKPGGYPNSIDPLDRGVIPVAILTTAEGEYDLPRAFDAGMIDATSVRFGPRDVLLAGLGASEEHGRIHLQDSYELDEETRDGDLDAVMHFDTASSGIVYGTVEACVLGRWIDVDGNSHPFFGCDSVRTVPLQGRSVQ